MHQINQMVYVGNEPWHGLGTPLPRNARFEEIARLGGFYEAEERELIVRDATDCVRDHKALVRGDDGRYLAIVGSGYKVVQFAEVARTMVEAAGMFGGFFSTAGTLGPTGVRGWLLGELPGEIVVKGDPSPIRKYLLGSSGHDGVTPIVLANVATRVVCANTLGVALGERGGARYKILHTTNAALRLEQAALAMRKLLLSYDRFGEMANRLAVTRLSDQQLAHAIGKVMPIPQDDKKHDGILRDREKIRELFELGSGIEGSIRGTAWAAFQAFTEFADHHRRTKSSGANDPRHARLESIWFGRAAQLKEQALTALVQSAGLAEA